MCGHLQSIALSILVTGKHVLSDIVWQAELSKEASRNVSSFFHSLLLSAVDPVRESRNKTLMSSAWP